jgi:DNA-directed RNA polymerase subunit H (RpoH/RPB5)
MLLSRNILNIFIPPAPPAHKRAFMAIFTMHHVTPKNITDAWIELDAFLKQNGVDRGLHDDIDLIHIIHDPPIKSMEKTFVTTYGTRATCQIFPMVHLLVNPTTHEDASQYKPISVKEFTRRMPTVDVAQLPLLMTTDPMTRWYNLKPSTIVEITSKNPLAAVEYRRVCPMTFKQ